MRDHRKLGTIQNNDVNNILHNGSGKDMTAEEYRTAVGHVLDGGPDVLAQNVGMPDPVIYRTDVATPWDKHMVEVSLIRRKGVRPADFAAERQADGMATLVSAGTDPLQLTIDMCRERGVLILASYRMNSQDWYENTWQLSDFGRAHPDTLIPDSGVQDPAIPVVYEHRMRIFAEVARKYDIDGIEFDYRRWCKMISNPLENHPILTKMVRETRRMLDETAREKGRERMMLGVRVGPSIDDPPGTEYEGGETHIDMSSTQLGLDVKTWIDEGLVDYVSPSLFWPYLPGVPRVAEFVALTEGKNIGIYPTVFALPAWAQDEISIPDMTAAEIGDMMCRHRDEICNAALKCYEDGADGISTYNWTGHVPFSHQVKLHGTRQTMYRSSLPFQNTELFVHRCLTGPEALRKCLRQEPSVFLDCAWSA